MSLAALAQEKFWANKAECEDAEKAYYMRLSGAKKPEKKADSEELDLFASDEEPAPAPAPKAAKGGKKNKPDAQKPKSRTTSESDKKPKKATKANPQTYLNVKNDEKTLVLLKPDAVHRNLMGDIICKFEERGFKLAAMKFVSASEDLLKNHYADLAKKPFFPELVRYMRSGPIVAMVWTGLNIIPMVRAMVGATRPMDAAPGSIRGDLCVDVGRNLIHASDSTDSAVKEVAMWFPDEEIVQWRPVALEWTYEDEVVEDGVDGIAAMAGGANADVLKKLKDLEIENKDLKKVTNDLKAMVLKLENRVAALEKGKGGSAAPAPKAAAKAAESDDDDVDLFGSDESEEEDDAEKNRVREERLAAYHAKKAKKPAVIAKTSVVLDIKPWDDETDMDAMLKQVKTITKEGLVWGASKLVPVGYGINKLRIMCVVEDEKVSIDELQEQIAEFEDYVQSCDVDSMQKI